MMAIRENISPERRRQANEEAVKQLEKILPPGIILSYAPFRSELDISPLNNLLAASDRLTLPKVKNESLQIFLISDITKQLKPSSWGILEPITEYCTKIDVDKISAVLVPGIAFDANNYRLGYGKGYYDHLLPKMKHAVSIGIGFLEQKIDRFPLDVWDHPLDQLMFF